MKVAHVVRQFYPSFGGLEDFVRNLASEQRRQGADVTVITLDTNFQNREKLASSDNIDGLDIIRVPYFGSTRYPFAFSVGKYLRDFDIIHIHAIDFFVDYLSLLKRLRLLRAKLIVSTHGGIFHTRKFYWLKKLFFRSITPFSLSTTAAVVASSYADGELFARVATNLEVIENGVQLDKFGRLESDGARSGFLFLGRFSENKNLHDLIRFFAHARADGDIARAAPHLYLAGRAASGDVDALRATVAACAAEAAITIIVDPSDAQILELIGRCGFVISASQYEGFGLVVPELMSYGLIPVLSNIPAFAHFVHASALGELFDLDQASFDAALLRALSQNATAMNAKARAFAEHYAWEKIAHRFEALYGV